MPKIIIASGPVIVEENKVLLNKHGDTPFYKFCGGKVEDYEHDLIWHAQRELKEEMGLDMEIIDPNPFFLYTTKEKDSEKIDVILVHFLAKSIGQIKPSEDIREWAWVPLLELEALVKKDELAPNIIPALKHFGYL